MFEAKTSKLKRSISWREDESKTTEGMLTNDKNFLFEHASLLGKDYGTELSPSSNNPELSEVKIGSSAERASVLKPNLSADTSFDKPFKRNKLPPSLQPLYLETEPCSLPKIKVIFPVSNQHTQT